MTLTKCDSCRYSSEQNGEHCYECVKGMNNNFEPFKDCRNCKKWDDCPCGKKGHENGTSQGYSIGECKDYEPCEDWYDVPSDEMTLEQARQAVKDLRKKLAEYLIPQPYEDVISREDAVNALRKALYNYEDKTEKQFKESKELNLEDWFQHRIFVQNMNDIDIQTILELPPVTPRAESEEE